MIRMITFGLVLFGGICTLHSGEAIPTDDLLSTVFNAPDGATVKKAQQRILAAPLYLRVAIAELCVDAICAGKMFDTPDYAWDRNSHDLRTRAGRAAACLESILRVELPHVTLDTTADDLGKIREVAASRLMLYRQGLLDVGIAYKDDDLRKTLKEELNGKITVGKSPDASNSARTMANLLDRWYPIGRPVVHLSEILGVAGEPGQHGVTYRFDTGYGGYVFEFSVKDGLIQSVHVRGID